MLPSCQSCVTNLDHLNSMFSNIPEYLSVSSVILTTKQRAGKV